MNFNYYQLYGLILKTKHSIKHLCKVTNYNNIDVVINFQVKQTNQDYPFSERHTQIYSSWGMSPSGVPYLTIWKQPEVNKQFLIIRYINDKEETAFFISDKQGKEITVDHHPNVPINDIYTYLLGPVIGCVLRLKNKVCLHASVVNINQKAVAFLGEKTAGKSTLIAKFAESGYPVL